MTRALAALVAGVMAAVAAAGAAVGLRRRRRASRRAERRRARRAAPSGRPTATASASATAPQGTMAGSAAPSRSARAAVSAPIHQGSVTRPGLQSIKGIGDVVEGRLREAGVTSVEEVAAWTDDDVERVASLVRVSAERIRREDWAGQARSLASPT